MSKLGKKKNVNDVWIKGILCYYEPSPFAPLGIGMFRAYEPRVYENEEAEKLAKKGAK